MKRQFRREEGQSILIIALALIALVALLGLVVDAGNAYVQRRKMQNAIDAGSEAGGLALAQNKKQYEIVSAIQSNVRNNGVNPNNVTPYYVVQDTSGNYFVTTYIIPSDNYTAPVTLKWPKITGPDLPVVGVNVQGNNTFQTLFAGVVGWRSMQVAGAKSTMVTLGPCAAKNLFPIVLDDSQYPNGNVDAALTYRLIENKTVSGKGRFAFVTWDPAANNQATLLSNMNINNVNANASGTWAVNDRITNVDNTNGTMSLDNSSVKSALQTYVTNGTPVSVPIYDSTSGSPYKVKGFARVKITNLYGAAYQDNWIEIKFQPWVEPDVQGGCTPYGPPSNPPAVVGPPPPPQPTSPPGTPPTYGRVLLGQIKINKITPVTGFSQQEVHVPIDVVNVLDISGSMEGNFGSMNKLQAAKQALTNFNNNMLPAQGDQVALVTFPLNQSSSQYSYSCTHSGYHSTRYFGQTRSNLTNNVAGVNSIINGLNANGGTPIADGIRLGRLAVLGANHQTSHPAIMILASDGIANIRLSGQWTGFQGDSYDNVSCNQGAVQDATSQANTAKSDLNADGLPDVTIFTIAVGNDFNPDSLRAIATTDTDPSKPHYFRATDASSMASIYEQIANRVETIQNESCTVIQTDAYAAGATVNFRNLDTGVTYSQQTNSIGEFFLQNAPPGTYQFQSASVTVDGFTYNIFTDGVGGAVLTSNPTVEVPVGSGTYKVDLALGISQTVNCQ